MGNPAIAEPDLAQFRMNGSGNDVHESRFASPVFAEDGVNFAGVELNAYIAERGNA